MSSPITTTQAATAFRPDVTTFEPTTVLDQAAILKHSTVDSTRILGDKPVVRVGYIADDTAEFVDEGAEIPESDPTLAEIDIYTRKFAILVKLSREQYGQIQTPEQLGASISRAMTFKSDNAFLRQAAPTSPATAPVAGLFNQTGLISATGVADNLDKLIDLEATVRANLGNPTVWLMAPDTYATLKKMKCFTGTAETANSNQSLLGSGTEQAQPLLLSIPVEVRPQMASKNGLLVDRNQVISAVGNLEVAVDFSTFFSSDGVAIRATWRHGHGIPRPERIGKFAVA
jgi:HK97 family phage major capsid protein